MSDLSPEAEAEEFLRNMPPRPKLLPSPWRGGSEIPTREAFGENYEDALLNYSKHLAVQKHNARILQEHEAAVQAYIRDTPRMDVEQRAEDPHAARIAEVKARLDAVDAELKTRDAETLPLTEEQMARLEAMTRMPENAGALSAEDYAAARQRVDKARTLLKMEQAFAADSKRKARL